MSNPWKSKKWSYSRKSEFSQIGKMKRKANRIVAKERDKVRKRIEAVSAAGFPERNKNAKDLTEVPGGKKNG